jgi:hypothetical protein
MAAVPQMKVTQNICGHAVPLQLTASYRAKIGPASADGRCQIQPVIGSHFVATVFRRLKHRKTVLVRGARE